MEQRETQLTNSDAVNDRAVETILTALTQDLKHLQQDLIIQLTRDVTRLQAEKTRLLEDISSLEARQQQRTPDISRPIAEPNPEDQQIWVQQLAQLVAANLEEKLSQRVEELAARRLPAVPQSAATDTDRLRDSVDTSFHRSYKGLTQELGSYCSTLSQNLNQLNSLQQQGEAILDTLVSRLSHELRDEVTTPTLPRSTNGARRTAQTLPPPLRESEDGRSIDPSPPIEAEIEAEVEVAPEPTPPPPKETSQVQTGLILALFYAAVLSVFNVSIKVILSERTIFGLFDWGGIISPSLGNSMLILFIRMVVVVVLMPFVAMQLYPQWWDEIQRFLQPENRKLQFQVVGSGFALFLSQVLIYIAIGNIPTAVAITLFFVFPIVTVLGAWVLFGARPTLARSIIMVVILFGSISAVPNFFNVFSGSGFGESTFLVGSLTALGSGVTFAGYVLLTQLSGKNLHPISFSLANFSTVFILSFLGLLVATQADLGMEVPEGNLVALLGSGVWIGVLTLVSYVLNNFAIKYAGASLASIVGATGPVMTALFGFFIIGEALSGNQIFGMIVVTMGVVALSLERMYLSK